MRLFAHRRTMLEFNWNWHTVGATSAVCDRVYNQVLMRIDVQFMGEESGFAYDKVTDWRKRSRSRCANWFELSALYCHLHHIFVRRRRFPWLFDAYCYLQSIIFLYLNAPIKSNCIYHTAWHLIFPHQSLLSYAAQLHNTVMRTQCV